jgi:hypothetical protein
VDPISKSNNLVNESNTMSDVTTTHLVEDLGGEIVVVECDVLVIFQSLLLECIVILVATVTVVIEMFLHFLDVDCDVSKPI